MTQRIERRGGRWAGWVLVSAAAAGAAACGEDPKRETAALASGCAINSECDSPLVCAFSRCHQQCVETRDCTAPQYCVKSPDGTGVCLLPDESTCESSGDCKGGTLCSGDKECRQGCVQAGDCLAGQSCAASVCVDSASPGAGGSSGAGGGPSSGGARSSGGATSAGGTAAGNGGNPAGGSSAGGSDGDAGVDAGGGGGSGTPDASDDGGGTSAGGSSGSGGTASGGTSSAGGALSLGGSGGVGSDAGPVSLPAPDHHWKLDDVGGVIVDSVGTAHGLYSGGISEAGKIGLAVRQTATTDDLRISDYPALQTPTGATVGLWWKPVFATGDQTLCFHSGVFRLYVTSTQLKIDLSGPSGSGTLGADLPGGALSTGTWHHIVWTYDAFAAQQVALFFDGVKTTLTYANGPLGSNTGAVVIGRSPGVTYGAFDDVFLSTSAFTDAQIAELYAGGAGSPVASCSSCLVTANWRLDDRPSPVASDSAGSSPATRKGYVTPDANGRVGEAARFDGDQNSHLTVPNDGTQQYTDTFSVAAWLRSERVLVPGTDVASVVAKGVDATGYHLGFGYNTGDPQTGAVKGPAFTVDGESVFAPAMTLQPGVWYHLVGTFDGTMLRLYVNGTLEAEAEGPPTPLKVWGNAIYIGRQENGFFANAVKGDVDEVLLYPTALTATEVGLLHDRGAAGLDATP